MGLVWLDHQMKAEAITAAHSFYRILNIRKMKREIWKDVKGYENLYQISNLGRVKSLKFGKERILRCFINGSGYYQVKLCKNGKTTTKRVHQLIAVAFFNHKPNGNKLVVNHIDFNKVNNHIDNLEIVTHRENSNLKHIKSSSKYTGVHWHEMRKNWMSQIMMNGKQKYLGSFKNEYIAHVAYQLELAKLKDN